MPLLTQAQIEAILARAIEADARPILRRMLHPFSNWAERPGWDRMEYHLRNDPEWRDLTDRQKDMLGRLFWQRTYGAQMQAARERLKSRPAFRVYAMDAAERVLIEVPAANEEAAMECCRAAAARWPDARIIAWDARPGFDRLYEWRDDNLRTMMRFITQSAERDFKQRLRIARPLTHAVSPE